MGTFSSEATANRHNSDKFETLTALQNDLRWLFLLSWFPNFPRGGSPDHPTRKDTRGNLGSHSFILQGRIQPGCTGCTCTPLVSEYMSIYSVLNARSTLNVLANQGCTLNIIKLNTGCILNATECRMDNKF